MLSYCAAYQHIPLNPRSIPGGPQPIVSLAAEQAKVCSVATAERYALVISYLLQKSHTSLLYTPCLNMFLVPAPQEQ